MRVRLRALQSFIGLEGRIRRGSIFYATEERAEYLTSGTADGLVLAKRTDASERARPRPRIVANVGPKEAAVILPTQPAGSEPTHVGGGWFEWQGRRYRGRAAAEAARKG